MRPITTQELIDRLRRSGHKVTPQRLAIFESILSRKDHPNADTLFLEMQKQYPTISRATIYNTLHVLKEIGLVQELGFDDGTTRYEPDTSVHINLICPRCDKIVDYPDERVARAWHTMVTSLGIKPAGQRLDLYRVCDECLGSGTVH